MGILDILKRGKSDSKQPEASAEFPELPAEHLPPLPESSLPPLPGAEGNGSLPMPPGMTPVDKGPEMPNIPKPEAPIKNKMESPELPELPALSKMPEHMEVPEVPQAPEMPVTQKEPVKDAKLPSTPVIEKELPKYEPEPPMHEFPEAPSPEYVPEKIPPLEGIGKVPDFKEPTNLPKKPIEPMGVITEMSTNFAQPIMQQKESTPKRTLNGPLFVKVTSFKDIMLHIEDVLTRFKQEDDIFFRMTDVKNSQDKRYENFRVSLEDVQRKLLFIDKTLFDKR